MCDNRVYVCSYVLYIIAPEGQLLTEIYHHTDGIADLQTGIRCMPVSFPTTRDLFFMSCR